MCLSFVNSSVKELTTFRSYSYIYAHTYTQKKHSQEFAEVREQTTCRLEFNCVWHVNIDITKKERFLTIHS